MAQTDLADDAGDQSIRLGVSALRHLLNKRQYSSKPSLKERAKSISKRFLMAYQRSQCKDGSLISIPFSGNHLSLGTHLANPSSAKTPAEAHPFPLGASLSSQKPPTSSLYDSERSIEKSEEKEIGEAFVFRVKTVQWDKDAKFFQDVFNEAHLSYSYTPDKDNELVSFFFAAKTAEKLKSVIDYHLSHTKGITLSRRPDYEALSDALTPLSHDLE